MRINVYAEELTDEIVRIKKTANGQDFYGLRVFMKSPESLHHSAEDDDRNAVTFWFLSAGQAEAFAIHLADCAGGEFSEAN